MNFAALSNLGFKVGQRHPKLILPFLRALPPKLIRSMRGSGFRRTLTAASRLPYYQDAFAKACIDVKRVRRPEDMGDFFLSADVVKQQPRSLLCGSPELAIESSGTSGHVSMVYLNRAELEYNALRGVLLYALYDLNSEDRLLCTFDVGFGLGSLLTERWVRHMPLFSMVAGQVDPLEAYERFKEHRFNIIMSDPFWLVRFTEIARQHGPPVKLKLMIGGSEPITKQTRTDLESFWDAPLCMIYTSTEAGTSLGWECLSRNGYHVNEFDFFVEIDKPGDQGYGEIVLTTVNRKVMPLIRYRTGDVGRWLTGDCPCGLPFRRLSLNGRVDDQVSCAWGNVNPVFFERILATVPNLADDWQVALYERNGHQTFQFRLEYRDAAPEQEEVRRIVLKFIEKEHPSAWQAFVKKLVEVEFVLCATGTLRKGRKMRRLVDERQLSDQ